VEAVEFPILSDKLIFLNVGLFLIRAASQHYSQPHQVPRPSKIRFFGAEGYHFRSNFARNGNFYLWAKGKMMRVSGNLSKQHRSRRHDPLKKKFACFVNSVINRSDHLFQEKMPAKSLELATDIN